MSDPLSEALVVAPGGFRQGPDQGALAGLARTLEKHRGRVPQASNKHPLELDDGRIVRAELHWYEAHGRGRHVSKIKRVEEALDARA